MTQADKRALQVTASDWHRQSQGNGKRLRHAFLSRDVLPGWVLLASCSALYAALMAHWINTGWRHCLIGSLAIYLLMLAVECCSERSLLAAIHWWRWPANWRASRRRLTMVRLAGKTLGMLLQVLLGCLGALPMAMFLRCEVWPHRPLSALLPLDLVGGACAVTALLVLWLDGHDVRPWDSYWRIGRLIMRARWQVLWQTHRTQLLFATLRGFFFLYGMALLAFTFDQCRVPPDLPGNSAAERWLGYFVGCTSLAKIVLGTYAFLIVSRLLDNHPRSVDTHPVSWLVTFATYPPLNIWIWGWTAISPEQQGMQALGAGPSALAYFAMVTILHVIYAADVLAWGGRYSQLSFRGLVDTGPFAFMRHPAYVSKCLLIAVMVSVQLLTSEQPAPWMALCFLFIVMGLYWARAWFEERHLSRYPQYRALYTRPHEQEGSRK